MHEHFADRITDKTISLLRDVSIGRDLYYILDVSFGGYVNYFGGPVQDVQVVLSRYTGKITIKDLEDSNQNPHIILPRERADN